MTQAVRLLIRGEVQGVGYRWWTTRTAVGLGLRGWVRNLYDGRVEVLAGGPPAAIEALARACEEGPASARVEEVLRMNIIREVPEGFHQVSSASEPLNLTDSGTNGP